MAKKHGPIKILQFNAHVDLYDELDGNRFSHACPFARITEDELPNSLTQIGIRTITQYQKEQVERFRVTVHQMKDLDMALDLILNRPLYVTFDLDVLDPAFVFGVSHHEPGGLSTREALNFIQQIKGNLVG